MSPTIKGSWRREVEKEAKTNPESCNEPLLTYQSTLTSLKENENTETKCPKILCIGNVPVAGESPGRFNHGKSEAGGCWRVGRLMKDRIDRKIR